MWLQITTISYFLTQICSGLDLIDITIQHQPQTTQLEMIRRAMPPAPYPPTRKPLGYQSKHWLFRHNDHHADPAVEDEKDLNIKNKIATLVQQTQRDIETHIKAIERLKKRNRDKAPYKIGFILGMIKKARDVLNELFNVAVKHRDEWKALEQLKIFELIVHTNVDTTNLVRQMVEIHIQHLNSTSSTRSGKRVVLL